MVWVIYWIQMLPFMNSGLAFETSVWTFVNILGNMYTTVSITMLQFIVHFLISLCQSYVFCYLYKVFL